MTIPHYWQDAQHHLSTHDPVMARLVETYSAEGMRNYRNAFLTLARAIIGQQISVKAADAVWAKFETLLEELEPESYLQATEEELRACGLSGQKIMYLGNIARAFPPTPSSCGLTAGSISPNPRNSTVKPQDDTREVGLTPDQWPDMDDDAIITQLTAIKGIGRWTAEMFLIFHLHRPDLLPIGDLGIVKAIEQLYDVRLLDNKKKIRPRVLSRITKPWQPYRTVATWYLWRSLDPVPVQY